MNDHLEPGVHRTETAREASGCKCWLPVNGRFLVTAAGRELCPMHGSQWTVDVSENRALLGCTTGGQSGAGRPSNVDSKITTKEER